MASVLVHSPLTNPEMASVPVLNPLLNQKMVPVLAQVQSLPAPVHPKLALVFSPQIRATVQALATNLRLPFSLGSIIPAFPLVLETGRGGTFLWRGVIYY
jgi:hypothetical protein